MKSRKRVDSLAVGQRTDHRDCPAAALTECQMIFVAAGKDKDIVCMFEDAWMVSHLIIGPPAELIIATI